ncbi:hypothetical protein SPBR_07064 [Sporothrix brasiliensis 5110]|uniref:Major facilitator superfamily (MFS) profile domain-containing protein n=1 Tax=Sporothrix brasiliensis 5110 TaxID=1398154 RepID=A0A0C2IJJ5_9PEZI|nr:uncharacterized protein SPBR_07064 [Sporothrix brasiliensis 5110]KIH89331.1 hypothetical protein SPBR_07064 [Sporothrix brasiliensis 5110]
MASTEKNETHEVEEAVPDPSSPEKVQVESGINTAAWDSDTTPEYKALDRRVLWKLDFFILPVISSVYFFASMGRSDLANAAVAGMPEELGLSAQAYSNAATMFLVSYIVFQLPGTLLVRAIGPPWQFFGAMVLWGLFTALSVVIHSAGALLALRFLIGVAEAFVQGAVFYLSFFYQYNELATRSAIFYSTSTVAGAFNGLIAYGIEKNLDGAHGWRAWRWIFLIEGILPIAFAFVVLAFLPPSPYKVRFGFAPEEKAHIVVRAAAAHNVGDSEYKLRWTRVPLILVSPHFWLMAVISSAGHFCVSSMSNFLPAIIKSFGYTSVNAQLFSVIVYVCAGVGVLFWARIADVTNARSATLGASIAVSIVGYAILIGTTNTKVRFFATCLVAFSVYPNIVLQLSWATISFAGYTRRGSSLALFNVISQCVSIGANQAYNTPPYYHKGQASSLALCCVGLLFTVLTRLYLQHENRRKRSMSEEARAALRVKGIEELGDRHPDFFYTL